MSLPWENTRHELQDLKAWLNRRLEVRNLQVEDFSKDFCDGVFLINLVEILTEHSLGFYHKKPNSRAHCIENCGKVLYFLKKQGVSTKSVGAQQLIDGDDHATVALLNAIAKRFHNSGAPNSPSLHTKNSEKHHYQPSKHKNNQHTSDNIELEFKHVKPRLEQAPGPLRKRSATLGNTRQAMEHLRTMKPEQDIQAPVLRSPVLSRNLEERAHQKTKRKKLPDPKGHSGNRKKGHHHSKSLIVDKNDETMERKIHNLLKEIEEKKVQLSQLRNQLPSRKRSNSRIEFPDNFSSEKVQLDRINEDNKRSEHEKHLRQSDRKRRSVKKQSREPRTLSRSSINSSPNLENRHHRSSRRLLEKSNKDKKSSAVLESKSSSEKIQTDFLDHQLEMNRGRSVQRETGRKKRRARSDETADREPVTVRDLSPKFDRKLRRIQPKSPNTEIFLRKRSATQTAGFVVLPRNDDPIDRYLKDRKFSRRHYKSYYPGLTARECKNPHRFDIGSDNKQHSSSFRHLSVPYASKQDDGFLSGSRSVGGSSSSNDFVQSFPVESVVECQKYFRRVIAVNRYLKCIEDKKNFIDRCMRSVREIMIIQSLFRMKTVQTDYNKLAMRNSCAQEILQTEKTYVEGLRKLIELFLNPLRSIISADDIKAIFSEVQILCSYNSILLSDLQKKMEKFNFESCIGDVLSLIHI
eukprot:TRINITY_DN5031_c0_g1_i1.p1 TRINITY_DN5031_c0_g1~~TRINITY_DN5031_c0_g1_i1.p1  ORF type:complete len:691 (-),score=92.90 TRINITY_DN5031_c0_g1_i1:21-2093(-)